MSQRIHCSCLIWLSILMFLIVLTSGQTLASTKAKQITKAKATIRDTRQSHSHVMPDEAEKSDFKAFRTELLKAITRKDKPFIDKHLSQDIVTALGGGKGKEAFFESWQNLDETSPFWARMERVMLHGAQYDSESEEYHAPSVSFDDSHSELPQAIIWNKQAAMRQTSDDNSPVMTTPYGEQVSLLEPSEALPVQEKKAKVKTSKGTVGFLNSNDFYSAYDEFAVFKKFNGKWLLTWFGFAGL